MDEIRNDLREIKTELKTMSGTLLRNTVSLEVHEKRTALAEKRIEVLEGANRWHIGFLVSAAIAVAIRLFLH